MPISFKFNSLSFMTPLFVAMTNPIQIYIGTYNRSAKLRRVLKSYSLWKIQPNVIVYDGSDDNYHKNNNSSLSLNFPFLSYFHLDEGPLARFRLFADSEIANSIFFLGNDEDVFSEEFCNKSFCQMKNDNLLSSVIGSYVSFWPPLLNFFPQLSLGKLVPRTFRLSGELLDKISTHILLNNSLKLPPLFYGPQRLRDFSAYLALLERHHLKYASCELLHQFHLLQKGDVLFLEDIMFIRDETRINYINEIRRQGGTAYIEPNDIRNVFELTLGTDSDICTFLNNVYSPSLKGLGSNKAAELFISSYSSSINPMVYSSNDLLRTIFRIIQGLSIRISSLAYSVAVMAASFWMNRSLRFFIWATFFKPLPVNG